MANASSSRRLSNTPFEALEARRMLSADPAALLADGFEPIVWNGQQAFARPGQFIVRIDGVNGRADQQLQKVNQLLGSVRKDLRATQHLGDDGLALITAPRGLTHAQLKASLNGLKALRTLEPDFAVWTTSVNDPHYSKLWGLHNTGQTGGRADADIDAPEAWNITRGDGSVVVGVIDSGVDYNHPDLANAIWRNPNETAGDGIDNDGNGYVDDIYGWNFVSNNNNPMDDNGHGTHVAGTIAATGNNGLGVAGVANAKILPLKFLSASGSGSTSGAIAAINYATKLRQSGVNLQITNNSWGGGGYSSTLYDAIKAHGNAGIMFVAAAGNGGSDQIGDDNDRFPQYPASYDLANIVSVAATDHNDVLASFSNFGAASVDLAAPGVSILSTVPGGYGYASGTSMAAPHVAGAAALAWSHSPNATVAQVRSALFNSVDKISSLSGKMVTGGRLNAHGTLLQLSAPAAPTALAASTVGASEIALSWTDNAGNESGFRIERSLNGVDFNTVATVGANVTTFRDSGLAASTTYTYRVAAFNGTGASGYSNTASATTTAAAATVPAAPGSLAAQAVSTSQINLTWTDNAGNESGFRIERSTDGKRWSQIATVGANVTGFSNTGLKKNATYYYRVRAYNSIGNSAYSNTASAKTFSSNSTSTSSAKSTSVFSAQLVQLDEQRRDELSAVLA